MSDSDKPRLYHAPSSYYSMIARLALKEAGILYTPVFMDIHIHASQQQPDYVRLNPNMTVPTLVPPKRVLDESRDIAEFALGTVDAAHAAEIEAWVDLHYSFPIEELTFGGLLAKNPIARIMIPKLLARAERRLLADAAAYPDLTEVYKARAAVFAERLRIFSPDDIIRLSETRRNEAIAFLDRLETALSDNRAVLVPPSYSVADVVWTVFLARMEFAGLGAEVAKRPALARYWQEMRARPSFAAADIWTRMHPLRLIGGILGIAGR